MVMDAGVDGSTYGWWMPMNFPNNLCLYWEIYHMMENHSEKCIKFWNELETGVKYFCKIWKILEDRFLEQYS